MQYEAETRSCDGAFGGPLPYAIQPVSCCVSPAPQPGPMRNPTGEGATLWRSSCDLWSAP